MLHTLDCIYVNTRFHGYRCITWSKIKSNQFEDWNRAPVLKIENGVLNELALKIAFRGILQLGSVSHRFLRLKLHKSGKFHAGIKFGTIDV